jgi:hypothetical protein
MNEPELRALVREVIARRARPDVRQSDVGSGLAPTPMQMHRHASHAMFVLPVGSDNEGPCLIEPAVMCTHCGYCRSYGH